MEPPHTKIRAEYLRGHYLDLYLFLMIDMLAAKVQRTDIIRPF